jgi:dihydroxyacetone kinase-like protein
MPADRDCVLAWLRRAAEVLHQSRDELTQLDSPIGDADHGTNMDRGFTVVIERLPGVADKDIGTILKTVGMALVSTVGGASGPLYGTAFLRAGAALADKQELQPDDLVTGFAAAVEGIMLRGKAQPGEKTMIDVLSPALETIRQAVQQGRSTHDALVAAEVAARQGVQSTIPMLATKGRASYLGERSIGHQDPGATSSWYLIRAMIASGSMR